MTLLLSLLAINLHHSLDWGMISGVVAAIVAISAVISAVAWAYSRLENVEKNPRRRYKART